MHSRSAQAPLCTGHRKIRRATAGGNPAAHDMLSRRADNRKNYTFTRVVSISKTSKIKAERKAVMAMGIRSMKGFRGYVSAKY